MTLTASSAFAAFADLELIRVYYDRGGNEIATDLGKVGDLTANGVNTTIAGSFTGIAVATSQVVYFALDRATNQLWVSGSTSTPSLINGTTGGLTTLKTGTTSMYSLYNTGGGTNYTGAASATNSYKNKISATQGNMANAITTGTRLNTEASLTSIATTNVVQTLYFWSNGLTTVTADKTGVAAASIITYDNGSTYIQGETPTPIPPAFFLMGSGLLGMFGLRRKARNA
jgi:hypothetical protein